LSPKFFPPLRETLPAADQPDSPKHQKQWVIAYGMPIALNQHVTERIITDITDGGASATSMEVGI